MKFPISSLKYFYGLLYRMLKVSWFNRLLFAVLLLGGCLDLFTGKDLTGGIAFMVTIIISYMMQIQKLKEDEISRNNPVSGNKLPHSQKD